MKTSNKKDTTTNTSEQSASNPDEFYDERKLEQIPHLMQQAHDQLQWSGGDPGRIAYWRGVIARLETLRVIILEKNKSHDEERSANSK
jgi:ABC-type uncharacterized transport system fused permease/ATPase subunit